MLFSFVAPAIQKRLAEFLYFGLVTLRKKYSEPNRNSVTFCNVSS
jgi:hypothetical protein